MNGIFIKKKEHSLYKKDTQKKKREEVVPCISRMYALAPGSGM